MSVQRALAIIVMLIGIALVLVVGLWLGCYGGIAMIARSLRNPDTTQTAALTLLAVGRILGGLVAVYVGVYVFVEGLAIDINCEDDCPTCAR